MNKSFLISALLILSIISAVCYGEQAAPLSLYYSGGTGSGISGSDFEERAWTYTYQYHVIGANGDTIMGALDSQLQFEERDGINQMAYMKVGLSSRTYSVNLGDSNASFSDLSLKSMSYQGANLTLKPSKDFMMTLVGGSRGNGYWGSGVRRDTRAASAFSGFRTTYYPMLNFGLNATYLTVGQGKELFTYGGQYSAGNMNFFTEYGSAGKGKGFIGEAKYSGGPLSMTTTYRDIDQNYENPVDYINYVGKRGAYSTLSLNPSNNVTITGRYDSYIDNLASDPREINTDTSADIYYNITPSTQLYFSNWKNDRKGYERGGVAEGNFLTLYQSLYFFTNYTVYVKMQPSSFQSLSVSEESYTEEKNIVGLNFSLFDIASMNIESESANKEITTIGLKVKPTAFEVRMDLPETKLVWEGMFLSSSIDFRQEVDQSVSTEATTTVYSDITLNYRPDQNLSFYVSGIITDVQGPDAERLSASQTHFKFGLTYSFNTDFYMKASEDRIEGYVFQDGNGNGKMEIGERGIPGIMVMLGNRVAITDSKGHYSIRGYKGTSAEIDMSTLPDGYICTTSSTSSDLEGGRVDFGLVKKDIAGTDSGFKFSSAR